MELAVREYGEVWLDTMGERAEGDDKPWFEQV
jgi:hypothetical protein